MPRRRKPPRPGALADLQPLRIASQIAALQGLYYAAALVLMVFTALVAGSGFTLDLVFGWEAVRGDTTQGWLGAFVWVLDGGLCMAVAIIVLIGRSKLVPDFALTMHGIHLVVVSLYTGRVPRNTMWWGAMATSSGICVALAIWGSRYRELQPISFGGAGAGNGGGGGGGAAGAGRGDGAQNGGPGGDEEAGVGFSRGRGRGRGRDGEGGYEMVGMDHERRDS
ncbi:integral membrane protein S linking to the trans Golgi network-domain-containing protein [Colletotrichum navitas]|uniref:Integral membrane protein S linking to the trans Golgi network-domain-containing protein n=1 Tax=Colletotrichum navitas TaxID=681940 RepID=A0AAD8PQP4_9PEZI|nr:integral membrane protein S linking to the trans Golgi network-domain-containing protein [Colletotrichum navitas]KAK1574161.1 integral membrane protein S linking to the trans Golgi network-domain-containing protein [Colletotrichum navitas]